MAVVLPLTFAPFTAQASAQKLPPPPSNIEDAIRLVINPPIKNYDQAVLEPLRAAQAQKAAEDAERARQAEERRQQWLRSIANRPQPPGTYANSYAWGNCTALVASMIQVPSSWGNAGTWAANAQVDGWTVSDSPLVGAIAQTTTGYYGHVAIVQQVSDGLVYIIEENYKGLGVVSYRWAAISDFVYIF